MNIVEAWVEFIKSNRHILIEQQSINPIINEAFLKYHKERNRSSTTITSDSVYKANDNTGTFKKLNVD